jgi:8-oxo-dGTP diphosphatase
MAHARDRSSTGSPAAGRLAPRRTTLAVDVVLLTPRGDELVALTVRGGGRGRDRWSLPWDGPRDEESLEATASRISADIIGIPLVVEQVGAFGDGSRHPGGAEVSVGYVALVPMGTPFPIGEYEWFPIGELPTLPPRQKLVAEAAEQAVRSRVEQSPIAFHLLPPLFTLSELQGIYELLLGRRLHKASFRRSLQAAALVAPIEEWRSEGRGRPAQLFRYEPDTGREGRRGLRFDFEVE